MIPVPVGKKVLVKQDEAVVEYTVKDKPKNISGLLLEPEELRQGIQELAKEKKLNYEYDVLEVPEEPKVLPKPKPQTGIVVSVGVTVDKKEIAVGDRIKFMGNPPTEFHEGVEYLLILQDSVLLNYGQA